MKRVDASYRRVGAILAGGQSKRMGRAKAGIRLPNGYSFAEQACEILAPYVDEVVLLGHGEAAPPHLQRIADAPQCEGPVGGLLALLRSELAEEYLVLSCDMPFVTGKLIAELLHHVGTAVTKPTTAKMPLSSSSSASPTHRQSGGGFRLVMNAECQPFPLWVHRNALAEVEAYVASGQNRWMQMLKHLSMIWLDVAADEAPSFQNINRPEDLLLLNVNSSDGE